jgi:hypothetical protein
MSFSGHKTVENVQERSETAIQTSRSGTPRKFRTGTQKLKETQSVLQAFHFVTDILKSVSRSSVIVNRETGLILNNAS